VHQSCILQGVYIGIALDLNRTVVSEKKLFHLDRNLQMDIDDERLIGVANTSLSAGFSHA
jgi:hypothetical protein